MTDNKSDKQLIGAAGEHLVLSRLLSLGMLAAQAPRGVRKVDILVNHLDNRAPSLVQVKSRSGTGKFGGWPMQQKHEEINESDLFFCFVNFFEQTPIVYVIPGSVVGEVIRESHSTWLSQPGKNGTSHKDTDMRIIKNSYGMNLRSAPDGWMDQYLEKWDLITG